MIVAHNFSLKKHNTFGLEAVAKDFVSVESETELIDFLLHSPLRKNLALVLGGGSNMLLTQNINGTVLHVNLKGKKIISEDDSHTIIQASAGENWHELVLWAIDHNLGGIENLSLIPGNIGTAPVQNIGAYGVELKDNLHEVDAIEIKTGFKKTFSNANCKFGYRESIFKNEEKGNYIITAVRLKLKKAPHYLSTFYGAIGDELNAMQVKNPSIKDISNAVIAIRQSKLPDPKEIGNSGSFFKNPIIEEEFAAKLKTQFPEMPMYSAEAGSKKVAAGWLIENAGWKGYRKGDAGVHTKQALVLVNYGNATGQEIIGLAHQIIDSVNQKFGITLSPEVNII